MPVPHPRRHVIVGVATATTVGLVLAMASTPPAQAVDVNSPLLINEVYGGGGNSGATLKQDFIELVNTTSSPVSLTGYNLWYASSTGAFSTSLRTTLTGTVPANGYWLVGEALGTGGTTDIPADQSGTIPMSGTSGKVALTTNGTVPTGSTSSNVADFVGYGSAASDGAGGTKTANLSNTTSAQRYNNPIVNTPSNAADFGVAAPTPKTVNASGGTTPPPATATIQDVQGSGFLSPYNGQAVSDVAGIVTAVKRVSGSTSQAFWIQQPTRDAAKPAASSGVQVFTGSTAPTVNVGDSVKVSGTVTEYYPGGAAAGNLSVTEISGPTTTVVATGQTVPAPLVLSPDNVPSTYAATPVSGGNVESITTVDPTRSVQEFYESHEGESASVNDVRVVGATTDFNEVYATVKPAEQATPRGGAYLPSYAAQPTGRIKIEPLTTTLAAYNVGDVITGTTTGPIDWDNFGGYLIAAAQVGARQDNNLQQSVAAKQGANQVAVATYNVENLSPVDPQSKFDRLAAGIVTNLNAPDVVTLEEIQDNDGPTNSSVVDGTQTLQQLADAVVAAGGPRYAFTEINPVDDQDGGQPGGNIRVAFFYNPDRVSFTPRAGSGDASTTAVTVSQGSDGTAVLSSNPGRIDPTNSAFTSSRKPLAAEFGFNGKKVIVVANHFNSKGGDQSADGRNQPPVRSSETQRTQQATVLNTFVKQVQNADPNANLVLAGDFNDYQFSGPVTTLTDNGATLTDLINTLPVNERYTYVFNGVSQVLDHIFITNNLQSNVQYEVVHLNAEFSDQASDHDPQVVRLALAPPAPTSAKITLLNINDFHGRIDSNTVKFAGTIEQQRAAAGEGNTVFLSAGDNIGASLFASSSQQDNPTIDVLNALDLQASAVGNHEFDQGYSDLTGHVADRANWDYLGANVYYKGTTNPALPEYKIVTVNGVKLGIIGAVTQETPSLVSPGGISNLDFGNPVVAVNRVAAQLTDGDASNGEADVLVAEYHAGGVDSESDAVDLQTELAKGGEFADIVNNTSAAVAAIWTGHTHRTYTFDAPIPGVAGKTRPVVQTGEYGSNIGNITLTVQLADHSISDYTSVLVPRTTVADSDLVAAYPRVAQVKQITDAAIARAAQEGNKPVGQISADITRGRTSTGGEDRGAESTLGNTVANALRDELSSSDRGGAEIGVVNPGGLRADLTYASTGTNGDSDGIVSYAEANAVLPFVNNLYTLSLTGAQFKAVLEQQFQPDGASRPFLNLGLSDNVRYTYDPAKARGSRITTVTVNGTPLNPTASYRIGTFSFLAQGGDNFTAFTGASNVKDTGLVDRDAWIHYLGVHKPLAPDFHKLGVVVTNQPTTAAAGKTVSFSVSKLNLTSVGSPANTTLTATVGGRAAGTFTVSGGAATVNLAVSASLRGSQTVSLTAAPTGTTVTFPITVTGQANDLVVSPGTVQAGGTFTAELIDWTPGQKVSVKLNTIKLPTVTIGSDGRSTITVNVPSTYASGIYEVRATAVSGAKVSNSRTITVTAKSPQAGSIRLDKTTVKPGNKVKVALSSFGATGAVPLTLEDGTSVGTVTIGTMGNGTTTFTVPAGLAVGSHQVIATAPDGSTVSATFQVSPR